MCAKSKWQTSMQLLLELVDPFELFSSVKCSNQIIKDPLFFQLNSRNSLLFPVRIVQQPLIKEKKRSRKVPGPLKKVLVLLDFFCPGTMGPSKDLCRDIPRTFPGPSWDLSGWKSPAGKPSSNNTRKIERNANNILNGRFQIRCLGVWIHELDITKKKVLKVAWIQSHHHQWKFNSWAGKFPWGVKVKLLQSCPWFEFSLKVIGSNPGYLLKSFQLHIKKYYPMKYSYRFRSLLALLILLAIEAVHKYFLYSYHLSHNDCSIDSWKILVQSSPSLQMFSW